MHEQFSLCVLNQLSGLCEPISFLRGACQEHYSKPLVEQKDIAHSNDINPLGLDSGLTAHFY